MDLDPVAAERERIATFVQNWLEDEGQTLEAISVDYRDAAVSGRMQGRRIPAETARAYGRHFHERAEAVYGCGAQLAKDIRMLGLGENKS